MSTSLSHNARAPYHLTLPGSVARAGTFFFLLFLFMWPFHRTPFLTDNLFGIQGLKPFNLLSAIVLAYLIFDTAVLHATDSGWAHRLRDMFPDQYEELAVKEALSDTEMADLRRRYDDAAGL